MAKVAARRIGHAVEKPSQKTNSGERILSRRADNVNSHLNMLASITIKTIGPRHKLSSHKGVFTSASVRSKTPTMVGAIKPLKRRNIA